MVFFTNSQMNNSAIALSVLGVLSSVFTFVMNVYLLKKLIKKKPDMLLFFYRFALDILMGFLVATFLIIIILYCLFPEKLHFLHELIFYVSLPASNVGAARSIITLTIALERNIAAYCPIFFHNNRNNFPTFLILVLAISFGILEDAILYGFCDFHLNMAPNCAAYGCALNACFFNYWSGHKSIIFALSFGAAITLAAKLLIWNKYSGMKSFELTRVNRLALIDAGNVCIFDFLPSFLANQFSQTQFFSFQNIGPYGAVAKLLGCAIEAFLVYRTFSSNGGFGMSESSIRRKSTHNSRHRDISRSPSLF